MFVKTQSGRLLNLNWALMIYVHELLNSFYVVCELPDEGTVHIAECATREEAEAVFAEVQDALAARGLCRVLMSVEQK
ncbi:MAG: hypothetical protein KatS3mg023_3623 [Armatimonadota bacterium]|nr:MAG: hypothetical protein KatS3mg023_3623 [Armatimonadota bacterium]